MEDKRITDQALSASSILNSRFTAQRGRLNLVGDAWNPSRRDRMPWLQVDFGRKVGIVQIATQGEDGGDYWVTSYSLSYKANGRDFVTYEDDHVC